MTEDQIRDELIDLLRYANATAIAEQLGVSPQAVINWSKGKHPSERRLNAIKRLYGLPVASQGITKEADEPVWARRLTDDVLGEIQKNRTSVLSAIEKDRQLFLDQAAAHYAAISRLLHGRDNGDAGSPGSGGPKPKRPGPTIGP